jgi:hypothetical protein
LKAKSFIAFNRKVAACIGWCHTFGKEAPGGILIDLDARIRFVH